MAPRSKTVCLFHVARKSPRLRRTYQPLLRFGAIRLCWGHNQYQPFSRCLPSYAGPIRDRLLYVAFIVREFPPKLVLFTALTLLSHSRPRVCHWLTSVDPLLTKLPGCYVWHNKGVD